METLFFFSHLHLSGYDIRGHMNSSLTIWNGENENVFKEDTIYFLQVIKQLFFTANKDNSFKISKIGNTWKSELYLWKTVVCVNNSATFYTVRDLSLWEMLL